MLELHLTIFVSAIEGFNREVASCRPKPKVFYAKLMPSQAGYVGLSVYI